jgi:adenosylcobinamide-GDP ribazoletransferase
MRKNDTRLISPTDVALSLVLLTRLPLPELPADAFKRQARAAWAFPLAGLATGLPAIAAGGAALAAGLPAPVAAGLILVLQILLTGAMHEDGLADCADGFWGGFTRERRLEIMKDSRIGTYGVLALVLSAGLRWSALAALLPVTGVLPVLAVAVLSRAPMAFMMALMPLARSSGLSRSVGAPPVAAAWFGLGVSLLISTLLLGVLTTLAVTLIAATAPLLLAFLAHRKIGGQTGDVLGATQQITEITLLIVLTALMLP